MHTSLPSRYIEEHDWTSAQSLRNFWQTHKKAVHFSRSESKSQNFVMDLCLQPTASSFRQSNASLEPLPASPHVAGHLRSRDEIETRIICSCHADKNRNTGKDIGIESRVNLLSSRDTTAMGETTAFKIGDG